MRLCSPTLRSEACSRPMPADYATERRPFSSPRCSTESLQSLVSEHRWPIAAPTGDTGGGSRRPLVTIYASFCLKTPHLIYVVDLLMSKALPPARSSGLNEARLHAFSPRGASRPFVPETLGTILNSETANEGDESTKTGALSGLQEGHRFAECRHSARPQPGHTPVRRRSIFFSLSSSRNECASAGGTDSG